MHSQSATFGKFKLNSLNLAPFLLLNPVEGVLLFPREWKPQPCAQSCAEKARLFEFENS